MAGAFSALQKMTLPPPSQRRENRSAPEKRLPRRDIRVVKDRPRQAKNNRGTASLDKPTLNQKNRRSKENLDGARDYSVVVVEVKS
jgi:hypothetical protein